MDSEDRSAYLKEKTYKRRIMHQSKGQIFEGSVKETLIKLEDLGSFSWKLLKVEKYCNGTWESWQPAFTFYEEHRPTASLQDTESAEIYSKLQEEQGDVEASTEKVEHPAHYNMYDGIEIIDLVEQMNFNRGNAVKYITRAGFKDQDTELEDLRKAAWYINREIERMTK